MRLLRKCWRLCKKFSPTQASKYTFLHQLCPKTTFWAVRSSSQWSSHSSRNNSNGFILNILQSFLNYSPIWLIACKRVPPVVINLSRKNWRRWEPVGQEYLQLEKTPWKKNLEWMNKKWRMKWKSLNCRALIGRWEWIYKMTPLWITFYLSTRISFSMGWRIS